MADAHVDRHLLLDELANDFAARYRRGERPALTEYIDKHPELADEIRDFFPAMVEIEVVKAAAEGPDSLDDIQLPKIEHLGDFRLLREIGHGGMGVVYEAEQISLGRRVALKLLTQRMLRDTVQKRRFEREAKAAARLHHTNIVPVFGSGEHNGTPYYVMQFIHGLGLDVVAGEIGRLQAGRTAPVARRDVSEVAQSLMTGEFYPADSAHGSGSSQQAVDTSDITVSMTQPGSSASGSSTDRHRRKLTYWQGVARIGVQVAEALEYAHRQGIIHRDVKPSNLLLDLSGTAWVTDFGLAKSDDQDNLTRTGDMLGTLRYMPPEAFDGKSDARGDVYGLGISLYEMLALRPAYDQRDRNRLIKAVTTSEPPRLRSMRISIPRDLETIVHKAIDREPNRRYRSAADLGADLQRFLNDEPIKARQISISERTWRWCRRYPFDAALLALIMLVFLAGFAGVFYQWRLAEAARKDSILTRNVAARQAAALLLDRGIEDARAGEPARALHVFVQALKRLPANDHDSAPLERAIRANLSAWAETVPALEHVFPSGPRSTSVAFTSDGNRVAMCVGPNEVHCFRTDTGQAIGQPVKIRARFIAMAFAADGRSLWVASPGPEKVGDDWGIHRFDPESGREFQPPIKTDGPIEHLICTPDGRYIVGTVLSLHPDDRGPRPTANLERIWRMASICVWEADTGRVARPPIVAAADKIPTDAGTCYSYAGLLPDGKTVTTWYPRGTQLEGLTFRVDGNEQPKSLGIHPYGAIRFKTISFQNNLRTAVIIKDGEVHRWSVENPGVLSHRAPAPFRQIHDDPSADGRSVSSAIDGRVFDIGAWPPRPTGIRFAHPGWQRFWDCKASSADGRFVATWVTASDGNGRLWRLPRPHSRPPLSLADLARRPERKDYYFRCQLDRNARMAVLWWHDDMQFNNYDVHNIRLVDLANGATRDTTVRHSAANRATVFSPDGHYFATGSDDSTARVWESATGRPAGPPLPHNNWVSAVAFSPDGSTLAAGDYGPAGLIKFWNWRTGKEIRTPFRHDDIVLQVDYTSDGRYIVATKAWDWSRKPEIVVWDVASAEPVFRVPNDHIVGGNNAGTLIRPDGRALLGRDSNGVVSLWDIPSGKLLGQRPLDGTMLTRFSPDGRVVAAAGNLGVRLMDGATLEPLNNGFLTHPDPIQDLCISSDGALLLTGHDTGSAQLWDLVTRKSIGPPAVLIGPIRAVGFTPDGKECICVAADGNVRRWPIPNPNAELDLELLTNRIALMTGQRMDDNQGLDYVPPDEWRGLRANLVGHQSTAVNPTRSDEEWHGNVATDAEQDGDELGSQWHLDRLEKIRPLDWTIPARRGRILAAAGRFDQATTAYESAERLAPSKQVLSDWLRARASDDEAAGRKEAALWSLERAIALTPNDWTLYEQRSGLADKAKAINDEDTAIRLGAERKQIEQMADRAAESGNWQRAATLLNTIARDPELPIPVRHHHAIACLKVGDRAGYRATCAAIAAQMPKPGLPMDVSDTHEAAKTYALSSAATDDWSHSVSWTDRIVTRILEREKADPDKAAKTKALRRLFLEAHGAILYRAGRFDEATSALHEAISLPQHAATSELTEWLFLALAEQKLGHVDAAKKAAAKARSFPTTPKSIWDKAEIELLIEELAQEMASAPK